MKTRVQIIIGLLMLLPILGIAQVVLQPWLEVFGTVNGQQLGKFVTGITPSANLPYKAAVSKVGSTGIYRLNTPTDTSAQQVFFGENLLTGDLNNDGFKDVVVSKTVNNYDTVYIYWGTASGIDSLNPLRIPGENQFDGLKPSAIGDINNDGFTDLLLTAGAYPGLLARGKIYIFFGPVQSSIPNAVALGDSSHFGFGLKAAIGDLNNDGLNDLVVKGSKQGANPRYDYMDIYWGVGIDTLSLILGLQMRTFNLNSSGLSCFDVNGDGRADLLWTARDSLDRVYVHFGQTNFDTLPSLRLRDPGAGGFGSVVASAGDVNGDGYLDIAVSAPYATVTTGVVFIFGGGPQIDEIYDARRSLSTEAYFGASISSLGDINGDGLGDIVVGAPHYDFFADKGYWGIFLGDSTIRVTSVGEEKNQPGEYALEQGFPNPFNPSTVIAYQLGTSAFTQIEVFNVLGQSIITLVNEFKQPGRYVTQFNGSSLPSGVYYYRMTARPKGGSIFSETKSVTLIK